MVTKVYVEHPSKGVMIMHGREYRQTVGGVYRLYKPEQKQEASMSKGALSNDDKKVIAAGLIKETREQYKNLKASDIAAVFSTAYTLARKTANGKD